MIEIILGVSSIIVAILFFILGTRYGRQQNKKIITKLKEHKEQNIELNEKVSQLNQHNSDLNDNVNKMSHQNKELMKKMEDLKTQYNDQSEMLEKSYQAIGGLKLQNKELLNKIGSLEIQLRTQKTSITAPKKENNLNKLIGELALYGASKWGKKQIDNWLYPDD
jgi:predicted RNase H-like nuclease (RuvC/YqgF family)